MHAKKKKKWYAQPSLRFKAGVVCQSRCTQASGDVAVNKNARAHYKLQTVIIVRHRDHKYQQMSVGDTGKH